MLNLFKKPQISGNSLFLLVMDNFSKFVEQKFENLKGIEFEIQTRQEQAKNIADQRILFTLGKEIEVFQKFYRYYKFWLENKEKMQRGLPELEENNPNSFIERIKFIKDRRRLMMQIADLTHAMDEISES